jgi:hypothetical protein
MMPLTTAASADLHGKIILGWREWVGLPELGLNKIKAKIDTGARTSALHAFRLDTFKENGQLKISFSIHPKQRQTTYTKECMADVIDYRWISDSGGHREQRYVIQTTLVLGALSQAIELTLTNRDDMKFRLLLGRTALSSSYLIDPEKSYLTKQHHSHEKQGLL